MMFGKDVRDDLSQDVRERLASCESAADLIRIAEEAGFELPDEQLDSIAGGFGRREVPIDIPNCTYSA